MITIRPSKREDTEAILVLRHAMFHNHRENDPRWNSVSIPNEIAGYWEGPETSMAICFVAESKEQVVGYIVAGIDRQGVGSIWEISVSPKGKGIGTQLDTAAVEWLIKRGIKAIEVTVPFWNAVHFKILEKLGFGEWTRTWRREIL